LCVRVDADQSTPVSVSRFATLSDEELAKLSGIRRSFQSIKQLIKTAINVLDQHARSKGQSLTLVEQLSPADLDEFLGGFYADLRKTDGSMYARNSLITLRYGLQKHFQKTNGIDIMSDNDFRLANAVFSDVLVKATEICSGHVMHKEPLTSEDFRKLYSSYALTTFTPTGLQNKVFVDLMVHLLNRGREMLRSLSRAHFRTLFDSKGNKYICMCDECGGEGRMYEIPGYSRCPVLSFEKYVSKLNPDCRAFWQFPVEKLVSDNGCWYHSRPVGKNILYNKMKTLSKVAGLSKAYTNHCLRATCITALHKNALEVRQVLNVLEQCSVSSSKMYSLYVPDGQELDRSSPLSLYIPTADIQTEYRNTVVCKKYVCVSVCFYYFL